MTVQINWEHPGTCIDDGGESGFLMLHDPTEGINYAAWPFHVTPSEHYMAESGHVWEWTNPDSSLKDITLEPSLLLEWDEPNTFHIYVRSGGIEHLPDCNCGCK